jgi:hypothetical protein
MDHPPYSPDLGPYKFWLFSKLKIALKGLRFADIQYNVTPLLRVVPENDFQDVSFSGIVSRSAYLHKESIWKATAAASAQAGTFLIHRTMPGINLSHLVLYVGRKAKSV